MKVKDLIISLLDMPMNVDVIISIQKANGDYEAETVNLVEVNEFCRCVEIPIKLIKE